MAGKWQFEALTENRHFKSVLTQTSTFSPVRPSVVKKTALPKKFLIISLSFLKWAPFKKLEVTYWQLVPSRVNSR